MEYKMNHIRLQKWSRAFTLIELLVVIAIIALLLSVLLPALKRAKQAAMQVTCVSNCSQWAKAMVAYTMDNDQYFPAKFWPSPYRESQNGLSFLYVQDRLDLVSIFTDPYLGDEKAAYCPGDRDETTTQSFDQQRSTNGWIKIAYCIYPGFLVQPAGYMWGDSSRPAKMIPLKVTKVTGRMPTVGCEVRDWEERPGEYWGLKHPYNKYDSLNDDLPRGQPNAFADGSASFVKFTNPDADYYQADNLLPYMTATTGHRYRFWWPGYGGWIVPRSTGSTIGKEFAL